MIKRVTDDLFSVRRGRPRKLDQSDFAHLIWRAIARLRGMGYFDEALLPRQQPDGERDSPGIPDASAMFLRRLKTDDVYRAVVPNPGKEISPVREAPMSCLFYPDVLWDTLELLYAEVVSQPYEGEHGFTYYDRARGREVFRDAINPDLALYDPPMEMLDNGQIVEQGPDDLRPLLDEPIPDDLPAPVRDPLRQAIEQYRHRGASDQDKRTALKHLADVLEPLRDEIDAYVLTADEKALFQIANKFWIDTTIAFNSGTMTAPCGSTGCSTSTSPRLARCSRCLTGRSSPRAFTDRRRRPMTAYRSAMPRAVP